MDVVVVGGGITGAALAHWLNRAGLRFALLERERPAFGATGRNAGFLLAGVAANYAEAVDTLGRARAREVWEFTRENHRRFAEAIAGRAGYARRGSWLVAADQAEAEELRRSAALLTEDGIPAEWATPDMPGADFGALLNPEDGELDSAAAVEVLLADLPAGSMRVGVGAWSMHLDDAGVAVETSAGPVRAANVVVATNAWAPALLPGLPIAAVRGQMLATAPVAHMVADRPVYSGHGYRYWRQLADGSLVLGGWRDTAIAEEVGFDVTPTARIQDQLDAHLKVLGVDAPVVRRWAGTMGFTPDGLPVVGPAGDAPGVWVCAGYSGHGMGFAFEASRRLVERIGGGADLPDWLRPGRFS